MWGLTLPERFMTQLVSIVALTRVMRGGRHRCIRSHCIAFDSSPGPPILLLPRSIDDVASFRVVLVGEFTPSQSSKVRKMHRIRNLKTVEDNTGEFEQGMNKEQQNICGDTDVSCVMNEKDESYVMERRMGISECSAPAMAQKHPETTNSEDQCERHFEVRRSDKLANDPIGDLFARMFPHLFFPFGRGHPGEHREVSVSTVLITSCCGFSCTARSSSELRTLMGWPEVQHPEAVPTGTDAGQRGATCSDRRTGGPTQRRRAPTRYQGSRPSLAISGSS
ncbi:hypothetical protein JG688_00016889 [Phytophthora aleatoria]|uniref:Uncharacterized protein n=1 Tax=Phytophthora aleatoria TaxID=2496075 RepID=A0A8J5IXP6_9STRA|nr:hypothetical protein JG688_00016889 [Phytophthora aleatoria]